ncbi:MAG: hypothetical protein OXH15_05835 [Gammaproteobacteria bacterium]|nr:hypothetical protein [Gammaproteobacteria bacterium]
MPTADDNARKVLGIFARYDPEPGRVLQDRVFFSDLVGAFIDHSDVFPGVERGLALGWFERRPGFSLALTDKGFAEIASAGSSPPRRP